MTVDLSGPLERAARHVHESLCQKVAERGFEVTRWEDLTDYAQGLRVAEVRPLVEAAFDGVPDLDALSDKVFDLEGQRDRARALAAALMDEDRRRGFDTTGPLVTTTATTAKAAAARSTTRPTTTCGAGRGTGARTAG